MTHELLKQPLVRPRQDVQPIECPFGHVQRIVASGEGGVANVHVVKITKGLDRSPTTGTRTIHSASCSRKLAGSRTACGVSVGPYASS